MPSWLKVIVFLSVLPSLHNKTAYSPFQTQRLLRATQHQKPFLTNSDNRSHLLHVYTVQDQSSPTQELTTSWYHWGAGELKLTFPRAKSTQETKSTNENFPYACIKLLYQPSQSFPSSTCPLPSSSLSPPSHHS